MKNRRHHNNKGKRQAKSGWLERDLYYIAKRLGLADKFKGDKGKVKPHDET